MKNSIKKCKINLYKFIYLEVENEKIKKVHVNTGKEKNHQFFLLVQEKNV